MAIPKQRICKSCEGDRIPFYLAFIRPPAKRRDHFRKEHHNTFLSFDGRWNAAIRETVLRTHTPDEWMRQTEFDRTNTIQAPESSRAHKETSRELTGGIGEFHGYFPISGLQSQIRSRLPGIYVFYDNRGVPIYVGQSIDLVSRIAQHSSDPWFHLVKTYPYIVVTGEELINHLEDFGIKLLGKLALFNTRSKRK